MYKKTLVLKIGTSTLLASSDRISYAKIEDLARQIVALRDKYDIIVVSSGSIATAKQFMPLNDDNLRVVSKQALAAIGQHKLMGIYDEVFTSFGLNVAQCLLVYRDFISDDARKNVELTIHKLLDFGYTPIINENDTVSADEIILGDNDKLSAYVAAIVEADLLVLASDIDGLYNKNPYKNADAKLIDEVTNLDVAMSYIDEKASDYGTGGMTTKIQAAEICREHDIEMWIVNGHVSNFLTDALDGKRPLTKFKTF